MGERWFRQEYLCEFVDAVSGVFDRDAGGAGDQDDGGAAGFDTDGSGRTMNRVFRGRWIWGRRRIHGDRGGGAGGVTGDVGRGGCTRTGK